MTLTTDFDGTTLPAGWSFEAPLGIGSHTVAGSRVTVSIPQGTAHDSISSTSNPDNSVGLVHAVAGGDLDIAFQVDSDVTDQRGQSINFLIKGSGSDAARFAWYKNDSAIEDAPRHYTYARAGSGGTFGNLKIETYQTGIPAWLRVRYTAATGLWESLDSSDGFTWVPREDGVRAFTPATVKLGAGNNPSRTAITVRINKCVDLLAAGTTDLRDPVPESTRNPVSTILGTDTALPVGWVNDSIGTSTVGFTGAAMRLDHDATQSNALPAAATASARIRWAGAAVQDWGLLLKVAVPIGNSACFLTPGIGVYGGAWIDQYSPGGGYGLEIQLAGIRRPIRVDDPTGTNVDGSGSTTGLNEVPYCWLKNLSGLYDMGLGGTRWFRMERAGRRVRIREWADGDTEPATWDLFNGQDQVEDQPGAPALSLSHNDVRTGTARVDVQRLEFYELTAAASAVNGSLSASLPMPTAAMTGDVAASGELAGSAPVPTAQLTATVAASGALAGVLPTPTAAISGTVSTSGTLVGSLPVPVAALDATVMASAVLAGSTPVPTAGIAAEVATSGVLAGVAPSPTATLAGTVDSGGAQLSAVLPMPTAALAGQVVAHAVLAGTTPTPVAALTGEVSGGPVGGELAGTLPLPLAAVTAVVRTTGALAGVAPMPTAALTSGARRGRMWLTPRREPTMTGV